MKSNEDSKVVKKKAKSKSKTIDKNQYLIKLAQLENERKRFDKEKFAFINFANQKVLLELIEILDSFFLALNAKDVSNDVKNWLMGFEMIKGQFETLLKNNGVEVIKLQKGDNFDPNIHNSIEEVTSDVAPGKIAFVIKNGYLYNGRLLRPAMVKTSKKKAKNT